MINNILKKLEEIRKNDQVGNVLYQVALTLYITVNFFAATVIKVSYDIILITNVLVTILLIIKLLFFDKEQKSYKMIVILLAMLIYLISKNAAEFSLYYYTYFIFCAQNVNFRSVLKNFILTIGIILVGVAISSALGIIPNIEIGRSNESTLRYSMGTIFPTDTAARVFYLMLAYAMLKKFKFNVPEYVSYISLMMITFFITDTKLDLIMMMLLLLCIILKKYIYKLINLIEVKFIFLVVGIFILGNIILPYIYSPKFTLLEKLNNALTGRLFYGHIAFKDYNVTLFGQYIFQNGWGGLNNKVTNYFFIDSSYVRLLMMLGMVAFIFSSYILVQLIKKLKRYEAYPLMIGLFLSLLSSSIDQHLFEIGFNIIFVALISNIEYFREKIE